MLFFVILGLRMFAYAWQIDSKSLLFVVIWAAAGLRPALYDGRGVFEECGLFVTLIFEITSKFVLKPWVDVKK